MLALGSTGTALESRFLMWVSLWICRTSPALPPFSVPAARPSPSNPASSSTALPPVPRPTSSTTPTAMRRATPAIRPAPLTPRPPPRRQPRRRAGQDHGRAEQEKENEAPVEEPRRSRARLGVEIGAGGGGENMGAVEADRPEPPQQGGGRVQRGEQDQVEVTCRRAAEDQRKVGLAADDPAPPHSVFLERRADQQVHQHHRH